MQRRTHEVPHTPRRTVVQPYRIIEFNPTPVARVELDLSHIAKNSYFVPCDAYSPAQVRLRYLRFETIDFGKAEGFFRLVEGFKEPGRPDGSLGWTGLAGRLQECFGLGRLTGATPENSEELTMLRGGIGGKMCAHLVAEVGQRAREAGKWFGVAAEHGDPAVCRGLKMSMLQFIFPCQFNLEE
uniref:Uncharacterized protein n=1 Tax=Cuerna arida TaxID=1464854 RepID=A0A1B6GIY2_9HEMI